MPNKNLDHWLALSHVVGVGPSKFHEYLAHDPQLINLPSNVHPDWQKVKQDLQWLQNTPQAHIITLLDDAYPQRLKEIHNPPPILYVLGDIKLLAQDQIAIVGSRAPSQYGRETANKFARELAALGLIITSGLATGIDATGHLGALAVGGKTIGVLAHGLDMLYPPANRKLAAEILPNGCLVSEFSIGTPPLGFRFVQRNRIISGLSLGVLIVEAALRSGSLGTARFAWEQNREVFAIPGAIHNQKVRGCHLLIKNGAKLVESIEDVLEDLANLLNIVIRDKKAEQVAKGEPPAYLTAAQQTLLEHIDQAGISFEEVVLRTATNAEKVGAALAELELIGLIKAIPGGYARKLG